MLAQRGIHVCVCRATGMRKSSRHIGRGFLNGVASYSEPCQGVRMNTGSSSTASQPKASRRTPRGASSGTNLLSASIVHGSWSVDCTKSAYPGKIHRYIAYRVMIYYAHTTSIVSSQIQNSPYDASCPVEWRFNNISRNTRHQFCNGSLVPRARSFT